MFDTVKEWLSSPDLAKDVTLQLMAAQIYLANGRLKEGQTNTERRQRGRMGGGSSDRELCGDMELIFVTHLHVTSFLLDSAVPRRQRR